MDLQHHQHLRPLFASSGSSMEDNLEGSRADKLQETASRRLPSNMSFEYFTRDPSHVSLELSLTTKTDDEEENGDKGGVDDDTPKA